MRIAIGLKTVVLAAGLALVLGGCGPSALYSDNGRAPAAEIPHKAAWAVSGDLSNVSAAADGDLLTAATSSGRQNRPALTIDLGRPGVFNMVVIDHGRRDKAFPQQLVLLTSMDGRNYHEQANGTGTRRVSAVLAIRPLLARYVRIEAVNPPAEGWAVGEVYLY